MAVNGAQPFVKVLDSNGSPIVGAVLHVYEVGTTTNRAIWSDTALSVALPNPLTGVNASNASGDFPRFYMAAGVYKLRAETSTGSLIWEWDNIDTGTATGGTLPIASGGTSATTAAAALTALGAAAASDVTTLAAQIATFNTSLQNLVSQPQGRLTLTSATPVLAVGVTAGTSVFYTPFVGNLVPIFTGSGQFTPKAFSELTLTLNSNHVLNSHYDVFIINDAINGMTAVTGPAWTTITAGNGARGSGAGTSELTLLNGIWVNANALPTARNGASTFSVLSNQGTYVGSLYIDGTAGQITCHTAYGQSRKWGVWNAYNQKPITLLVGDSTASWSPATNTFTSTNSTAVNVGLPFCGLPTETIFAEFYQNSTASYASNTASSQVGIGINSGTVATGLTGEVGGGNTTTTGTVSGNAVAYATLAPKIGFNNFLSLELRSNTVTNTGGIANCLMTLKWLG